MTSLESHAGAKARRSELAPALAFIAIVAVVLWTPLVWALKNGETPLSLFNSARDAALALMFVIGAVIANVTAVGGGMVFNPTLQFVFGVSGFSALSLAVLVQAAGMVAGTYGWAKKGEFGKIERSVLVTLLVVTIVSAAIFQVIFLWLASHWPVESVLVMRVASAAISFYVFGVVWKRIRAGAESSSDADGAGRKLSVDGRIYPWLLAGTALNVATSLGVGELVTSHLIKFYNAPAKTAVAIGVLLQAVCVWVQALFIVAFFQQYIILDLVLIGVMFCIAGGRLAPLVLTMPAIEPYARHLLAFAALAMGLTSVALMVRVYLM